MADDAKSLPQELEYAHRELLAALEAEDELIGHRVREYSVEFSGDAVKAVRRYVVALGLVEGAREELLRRAMRFKAITDKRTEFDEALADVRKFSGLDDAIGVYRDGWETDRDDAHRLLPTSRLVVENLRRDIDNLIATGGYNDFRRVFLVPRSHECLSPACPPRAPIDSDTGSLASLRQYIKLDDEQLSALQRLDDAAQDVIDAVAEHHTEASQALLLVGIKLSGSGEDLVFLPFLESLDDPKFERHACQVPKAPQLILAAVTSMTAWARSQPVSPSAAGAGKKTRKRRGRPKGTNVAEDRSIASAWKNGNGPYTTHADLAKALGKTTRDVKLALDRQRKRQK